MNARKLVGALAAASLLVGTAASAQTVPSTVVNVSSNPITTSISPGTNGASVGTFTLSAPVSGSASIASIPLTLNATGGATASNLSNCQIFNAAGTALNTGSNIGTINQGTNTVTFDQALNLSSSGGSTTYTVRCNVASGTSATNLFTVTAGAPTYSPGLMVTLNAAPTAQIGTNAPLAIVTLDATRSGQNIRVSSLPLVITAGTGNNVANLSNCTVRAVNNLGVTLNTGANAVNSFTTGPTITLDTPLTVPAGSSVQLAVSCNTSAASPVGGSYVVSLTPGAVAATNASTGGAITPSTGLTSTGGVGSTFGTVLLSNVSSGGGGSTPGLPNTGSGGESTMNTIVLALAALAVLGGAAYLTVRRI